MYIPVTYWNNQLATRADLTVNYSATSFSGVPQNFTYLFDGVSISGSATKVSVPVQVCMDVVNSSDIIKSNVYVAGTAFFCNAAPSTSFTTTDCINYTFEYGGIGCSVGGAATAEWYDCSGNQQLETVYWGQPPITRCVTSVVDRSCVREVSLGTVCGSRTTSQPSQCCINSYPNTGVEAWYIDITYGSNLGDKGLQYYNYIDINGNIVNDTIAFGQTKRIISQCNPMAIGSASNFYGMRILWTIVSKFPGQVLAYPYKGIPCDYTLTLKRDSAVTPGNYFFPYITSQTLQNRNGFWSSNLSSSILIGTPGSLNSSIIVSSEMPPLDGGTNNNEYGSAIWITNVTPKPKGALLLSSCLTTHSLWVTLDDYAYYNTGSVLKVNNTELTTTSSCWTVTNLTSSLSTSVSLTNVDVSASFSTCFTCLSGSITSSLSVEYLLVAGGGGGGAGAGGNGPGAGGGAGGLLSGSFSLQPSSVYPVTIGLGGRGGSTNLQSGSNGQNSSVFSLTAIGGGGGAGNQAAGSNGGSGGGAGGREGTALSGGLATSGQGNNGGPGGAGSNLYPGGGGGGASSAGTAWIFNAGAGYLSYAGSGGSGSQWLDGNYYAGGGSAGGGNSYGINPGTPGIGGGGTGGDEQFGILATAGAPNKGAGGGGGASFSPITGASGSAGINIIRYPGTTQLIGGGSVSISGSYVYHTFTSSANIST